jgi:hypothetical protein
MIKLLKSILIFTIFSLIFTFSYAQKSDYKVLRLSNFGEVSVPIILDTVGARIYKQIVTESILETSDKSFEEVNSKFKCDINRTILNYTNDGTIRLWNYKTLNYFFDTLLTIMSKGGDINAIESSKIEIVPNISLKKDVNPVNSYYVLTNVFQNKDSISSFLGLIEGMLKKIKTTITGLMVEKTNSSYVLIDGKYPLVTVSSTYLGKDNIEYISTFNFFYKENYRYNIKFEYKKEDSSIWEKHMSNFFKNMKL